VEDGMSKVLSTIDYWEDFHKKYHELEPFREFVAEDPILTKIFNIVAVPNILFSAFDKYPFDEKLSEINTIQRDEVSHLYDAVIRSIHEKKVSEWLDYLIALFELVRITTGYYSYIKKNSDFSAQVLLEHTLRIYKDYFSIHKINICENIKGERFERQLIGRITPEAWFEKLEVPGEVPKIMVRFHFHSEPTEKRIEHLKNHFDAKSVLNYRGFRSLFDDVTYGGFDPSLDNIGRHSKRVGEKFLVEFFYNGKKIDDFEYSIRKRFKKELKGAARYAKDDLTKATHIADAEFSF
jgi:hypothetical protein